MSTDHAAQARECLAQAGASWEPFGGLAQAHALLAVAAELRVSNLLAIAARFDPDAGLGKRVGAALQDYLADITATQPESEQS